MTVTVIRPCHRQWVPVASSLFFPGQRSSLKAFIVIYQWIVLVDAPLSVKIGSVGRCRVGLHPSPNPDRCVMRRGCRDAARRIAKTHPQWNSIMRLAANIRAPLTRQTFFTNRRLCPRMQIFFCGFLPRKSVQTFRFADLCEFFCFGLWFLENSCALQYYIYIVIIQNFLCFHMSFPVVVPNTSESCQCYPSPSTITQQLEVPLQQWETKLGLR